MKSWFKSPWIQIALCISAYALVGFYFGKFALVVTSPLLAIGIRRPLIALASNLRHAARAHMWLPKHGQHYEFRDIWIHVVEDDNHCRWVDLADARKVVGTTATERSLAGTYPGRVKSMGKPARPHMRDDALIAHLTKENRPEALRFSTWIERNIALPGRKVRKNFGISTDTLGSDDPR